MSSKSSPSSFQPIKKCRVCSDKASGNTTDLSFFLLSKHAKFIFNFKASTSMVF